MPAAPAFPPEQDVSEARPRDFSGRFNRRARGVGTHRRVRHRRWTLAASALAAVALPAFAAPGGLDRFAIADAAPQTRTMSPMAFEQPGGSFPGSAFYYLDVDAPIPGIGQGIRSDADDVVSGPIARSLRVDNSGVDRTRALQCLTAAIYYEAASEPDAGQRAVAQVVLNRVAHPAYPKTVCGVVYEGSERSTGCQFSFTCDGALARRPMPLFWERAMEVARRALAGYVYAPAGLATHYHTLAVHPYWADSLNYLGAIGSHRFYSFRGSAGSPATFRFAYFGGEPMAAPHRRDDSAASAAVAAALDPLAVQHSFGVVVATPPGAAPLAPSAVSATPTYTAELRERGGDNLYRAQNLPQAHGIRPEYANAGRWIAQPGT